MTFFHRANYLQLPALTNHHPSVGNIADAKRTGRCCVAIRFLLSNLFWSGYKERFIQTIKHFVAMQNFHNQFVALYTLYLSSQYLPLTRHSIDWCREIKCYVPSKHQYCQFEKIRICKHWHLKGVFVYSVNSSKCYNQRAADRLHWQQGHHNHIWYLHDAFSPRHVTSRVPLSAVSPGTIVLSAQWCHLVSPRICTLYLHAAQGARLPVCTVQHSVLLLLLLLLIRSSWQKKFAG